MSRKVRARPSVISQEKLSRWIAMEVGKFEDLLEISERVAFA